MTVFIGINLALLAMAVLFTWMMWKYILRIYLKKMRDYIPSLIAKIRNKEKINKSELVTSIGWTACNAYLVYRVVILYIQIITMLRGTIMGVAA